MLTTYLRSTILAAAVMLMTTLAHAQTIAYDVPLQAGNQVFTGNLGLDFDVNQTIVITSAGIFDSNGDGLATAKSWAIYNRDTMSALAITVLPPNIGQLINGSRFVDLTSANDSVVLPPGHYSVVIFGFGAADPNGNSTIAGYTASTENTGGGLITFVGTGRYDSSPMLDYPTTVPPSVPSNVFLAGSFKFQAIQPAMISKTFTTPFGSGSMNQGDTVTLSITLTNPNPGAALTGVAFTDNLPSGLVIQTPNALTSNCGGVTTAASGTSLISLTGGSILGGTSCTISVNVTGNVNGTLTNTTSTVTSNEAGPGVPATASIYVNPWWLAFFY